MFSAERRYRINGGQPLEGTIRVSGAKNAITKQLVASVLTDEPCCFHDVPDTLETKIVLDMLSEIGTQYEWLDADVLRVQTRAVQSGTVSQEYSGVNRIPILMLGPLLHRVTEVMVPVVGGCQIDARPVNFHFDGLRKMGAEVQTTS